MEPQTSPGPSPGGRERTPPAAALIDPALFGPGLYVDRAVVDAVLDARGWSVADLAQALDRDRSHLSHLLNGRRSPTPAYRAALSQVLDVEPDRLFVPRAEGVAA